jgi:hypothetical protein
VGRTDEEAQAKLAESRSYVSQLQAEVLFSQRVSSVIVGRLGPEVARLAKTSPSILLMRTCAKWAPPRSKL